ncbi:1-deoxy-D-xylulose-5-phosphate reductoisomerase [Thermomonas sp.]|jgi:1-deoxy-D-xylulose-5-phosphate reductoisomerase|uniref:1-deoxy-D-xylulose-5-phosphate reductoisomerase n=1 Tax=Thermomonas sp. TaxID=1971895 RepID=UPI001B3CA4B7|nr:1-deoxy-D-xylulose-5-phosphate reductoisomerase [Thermomonas sp.]HRA38269.1 1-deoxy-D-xylulose-5-phosphate reductoisomerase [Pseudomonadota bacterium]MBK6416966.1 1-deoxy-D-xylulose-5-phosphate reductoisomerase [Thermomonas sp.]MBK6924199.1 1-deoxy-D-xylulose-5-phosphate reductoisomerase [Thermomonas sp.]MBL0227180.1 1-deoxy-D-xylulose-5-phosphate reductoisomerase [Thermomonas sp.]MBP6438491.1 1-deoxy-D-xylulose-5-phosphate reductoisomerase [Thermomonas sp.]
MQRVAILGATGSIGASALDVVARHPGQMRASVLAAGSKVGELVALCRVHQPEHAVVADPARFADLRAGLVEAGLDTQPHAGGAALDALAASDACDSVVAAIVGAAGLSSTLAAARAGKRLLLANKESLVLAGELLMQAAHAGGATIVPIDSEHNAVFQCWSAAHGRADGGRHGSLEDPAAAVSRITLTASGGPFRGRPRATLAEVTPAQAVAHPKWSMGPKISVDSATLMNKGLEVIEAHHLFGLDADRIRVLVHPQSLVHAIVDFVDGSSLAQLGLPDMRTALAVGLGWPRRIASGVAPLDLLAQGGKLEFEPPDLDAFPCLALAWRALAAGGTAPAALNAANEEAVSAFLQGRIGFLSIPDTVAATLDAMPTQPADSLDALLHADARARAVALARIDALANRNHAQP